MAVVNRSKKEEETFTTENLHTNYDMYRAFVVVVVVVAKKGNLQNGQHAVKGHFTSENWFTMTQNCLKKPK